MNDVKVKMVNKILAKIKSILKNDPTVEFLDLLDEVTLPTNSDAVLIIAHFKGAMDQFKERHFEWTGSGNDWTTSD